MVKRDRGRERSRGGEIEGGRERSRGRERKRETEREREKAGVHTCLLLVCQVALATVGVLRKHVCILP